MRKVSIIGAGAVGSTAAYSLAQSSLVDEIVIVDINEDRAWGQAWDIAHGVPLLKPVKVISGTYNDTENSDVVVITVGVPEVVGESRLIPLKKNAEILSKIVPTIVEKSPNCKILVVSNPVDILTYVTYKYSGLDKSRVLGLGTVLDTSRFKCMLSKEFDIDASSIQGFVLGEHGDSQLSAWSLTNISGVSVDEFSSLNGKTIDKDALEKAVKQSAFDVWEKKGPNCYCVADSITTVIEAILRNSNTILPVSSLMTGEYGLNDLCISIPTLLNESGVVRTYEVKLTQEEEAKLVKSGNMLKSLIQEIF